MEMAHAWPLVFPLLLTIYCSYCTFVFYKASGRYALEMLELLEYFRQIKKEFEEHDES